MEIAGFSGSLSRWLKLKITYTQKKASNNKDSSTKKCSYSHGADQFASVHCLLLQVRWLSKMIVVLRATQKTSYTMWCFVTTKSFLGIAFTSLPKPQN